MATNDRIYLSPPHMGGSELGFVHQAFESNFIAPLGPQLAEFEAGCSRLTGHAHCVAVSSGTAAIHLGLRLLGVGPGDVVVASTLTFIGSISPATFLGADLHFVDCDAATWTMDPALLADAVAAIRAQGRRVAAVVPTDLYGQCADYDALLAVCDPLDVPLFVDAAESVGATYKGRHAGCRGVASAYSFNGNKIITTGGGGLLSSDDKAFITEARRLSQQARDPAPHYEHTTIGYNYRMSNVAAAIGLGQLAMLETFVARRRGIFDWYREALSHLPGVSFMPEAAYGQGNRWLTVMLLDEAAFGAAPEDVRLALEAENIESRPVWKPMHLQPVFRDVPCTGGQVSEDLFLRGLCLPSGTALTEADLTRVARVISGMAGRERKR
ncbi:MAG: DegT/DnrJ/EryC1/StrS family aminotransferase [Pseudodesulfovibrio sp.]|uniref:DegT/DnrJ/EryC1/StrS aminotransferase n=1 Tax=Pseudodesulfovibrio aespoeensis (strain ATCC 700646 / DSM 10631 / Aspo-2) TaxID=643562 RepID=E6VR73_PSEA9|nr:MULTISPECIES: DegT/DnrJ/EryC1/StrS family aminotransferase [Pseudodesulfovibrio]MBU4191569.1 DegT/DnrJ/EryC1/StrS family aminotransferase [Pseudomonadota bacterium]ADU64157.1 DegT/DnrJ/EryC1/StrS aminotransferase [Pseudodesulfovibrio aespoeensis Aspo-2]MBU4245175.1 DegT/DnrJ/EryC1/StrS family aminotransferase [Pseudomonadota bacterium]MBU4378775.1 DegT/DnrJ/EryC1/StrS family aminotransferase [Pseudomonadota bacterium]MBU4475477.1 DegT/DnrJ/EryC1/StrS family aminotransferase [Pseudomonadota 